MLISITNTFNVYHRIFNEPEEDFAYTLISDICTDQIEDIDTTPDVKQWRCFLKKIMMYPNGEQEHTLMIGMYYTTEEDFHLEYHETNCHIFNRHLQKIKDAFHLHNKKLKK